MAIILKTFAATLTLAIFGFTVHHVTHAKNQTSPGFVSSRTPINTNSMLAPLASATGKLSPESSEAAGFRQLREKLELACAAAEAMPGYTATLEMQEEIGGELRAVDFIEFKMRRKPFSAYMRWHDTKQEALYVDGENNNRVIVKPSKGLAAIRRVWRLEPNCAMAKRTSRYSITDVGIENLILRIQEFYSVPADWPAIAECKLSEATLEGRNVTVFDIRFNDEKSVPEYSASNFCFDKETQLLIAVNNYGWSDDGTPRLIEHYFYDQINPVQQPSDNDFRIENPAYEFVAR